MILVVPRFLWFACVLAAGVLAACTADEGVPEAHQRERTAEPPSAPGRAGQTFVYECSDGSQFTARIEGEQAWLFLRSGTVSLPHVRAASGAKFSDGTITYWSKGDTALLERPGQQRAECNNNRRKAIWEDAKLRGADFRAIGNEPGWNLELSRDYGIVFVTNYGADEYRFALPDPVSDKATGTTLYSVSGDGHELSIRLQSGPCLDTMSDERYETKVKITFDGTELNGCGRPLH